MYDAKLQGEEESGFRKHYSTTEHMFTLRILTHFFVSQKRKLFCAFIDYRKGFDYVDMSYLWVKLLNTNINVKVLQVVRSLYS